MLCVRTVKSRLSSIHKIHGSRHWLCFSLRETYMWSWINAVLQSCVLLLIYNITSYVNLPCLFLPWCLLWQLKEERKGWEWQERDITELRWSDKMFHPLSDTYQPSPLLHSCSTCLGPLLFWHTSALLFFCLRPSHPLSQNLPKLQNSHLTLRQMPRSSISNSWACSLYLHLHESV